MNKYNITINDLVKCLYNLDVHGMEKEEIVKKIPQSIQDMIGNETEW